MSSADQNPDERPSMSLAKQKRRRVKEKAMGTERASVENPQKPTTWRQEWLAITIAVMAAVTSIIAAVTSILSTCSAREATNVAKQELIAAHRPYVYVSDRRDSKDTMDVDSVMVCCLNAPARIIKQEFSYEVVETKENGEETVLETVPWNRSFAEYTAYPSEKTDNQVTFPKKREELLAKYPKATLMRKARIDYKEVSTDKTYWFEGSWHYNQQWKVWDTDNMRAN